MKVYYDIQEMNGEMKKELFYIEKIREELGELERIVKKEGKEKRERKEKLYIISILEIISFDLEELKELVWKGGKNGKNTKHNGWNKNGAPGIESWNWKKRRKNKIGNEIRSRNYFL